MEEGRTVEVQSVQAAQVESTNSSFGETRKLFATVAYYYPQYTLEDIDALPYRDVVLLLNTAEKIEAQKMYHFTMIASAPHGKDGKGVKSLMEHFKGIFKG